MCRRQLCLAFLAFAEVVTGSELSCADSSCIAETGVALLQNRDLRSMKINRVSGISQDHASSGRCKSFSQGVSMTETGYNLVKASCCFDAMSAFINKYAEELGFTVCGPGFAPGLALWHSCQGEGARRTFQNLTDAINDHSKVQCTALSVEGEECKNRSGCPDYSGVPKPPGCDCSTSKFVDLDFNAKVVQNNLGGKGPNTADEAEIRWEKIGKVPGKDQYFDLVITSDDSVYKPGPAFVQNHGSYKGKFGKLTLMKGYMVDLKFTFVKTKTSDEITLGDVAFTFFDLDGDIKGSKKNSARGAEGIRASEFAGYITEDDSFIKVENKPETGQTRFYNSASKNVNGEYKDPMKLKKKQRKVAVMLFFKDVSSFTVTYAVNPVTEDSDEEKSVGMLFSGKSALTDHCAE